MYSLGVSRCWSGCAPVLGAHIGQRYSQVNLQEPMAYCTLDATVSWASSPHLLDVVEGVLRDVGDAHVGVVPDGPEGGSSSPVSTLIMVDLPAPLGPSTATRLFSVQNRLMSSSVFFSAPGYLHQSKLSQIMCSPEVSISNTTSQDRCTVHTDCSCAAADYTNAGTAVLHMAVQAWCSRRG